MKPVASDRPSRGGAAGPVLSAASSAAVAPAAAGPSCVLAGTGMVDNIWRNGRRQLVRPRPLVARRRAGHDAGERVRLHPRRRRRHAGRGHARRPDGLRARPRLVVDHEVGQRALRVGRPGHPTVPDPAGVDGRRPGRDPGRQRPDPRHRHRRAAPAGPADRRSAHRRGERTPRSRRAARGRRRRRPGHLADAATSTSAAATPSRSTDGSGCSTTRGWWPVTAPGSSCCPISTEARAPAAS